MKDTTIKHTITDTNVSKHEGAVRLAKVVPISRRAFIYLISACNTIFLAVYAQRVCPFLDALSFEEVLRNLLLVFVFQTVLREVLFNIKRGNVQKASFTSSSYWVLFTSWIISGVVAMGLHEYMYNNIDFEFVYQTLPWRSDYPWHSHLKVLSGYWLLGAGLLTQLEVVVVERSVRRYLKRKNVSVFLEQISSRITIGNFIFSFVPSIAMLLMVVRYAIQDRIIPVGVMGEIAYIGLIFVVIAIIAAFFYGAMLREDAKEIVRAVTKVKEGDFEVSLETTRQDELGRISAGINEMAEGLQMRDRIKDAFGHFVNPDIAERFVEQYAHGGDMRRHGEKKNVVVLMSDIRGFTQMSSQMDPSAVTTMLNEYFDHMVQAITKHGGMVDKFIGDAVMAVFGLLDSDENVCNNAVNAAMDMRKVLRKLNMKRKKEGLFPLENGIGIHYGEVITCYLGSVNRLDFTVIGATVNTASRLESHARKPNPAIIFSESVAQNLSSTVPVLSLEAVELKGIGKTSLYSVNSPQGVMV